MFLFEQISSRCTTASDHCRLRLSEVTDFEWDRVAFIRMQAAPSQAAAALGVKALPMPEFVDWIVFVKGDQVIRIDKRPYHPERPFDRTVFLDFDGRMDKWRIFSRDQDLFDVVMSDEGSLKNILLRPVVPG